MEKLKWGGMEVTVGEFLRSVVNVCSNKTECVNCPYHEKKDPGDFYTQECMFGSLPEDWDIEKIVKKSRYPLEGK